MTEAQQELILKAHRSLETARILLRDGVLSQTCWKANTTPKTVTITSTHKLKSYS